MDIKDLNKQQLILLAVLLSFVTSIATGIVTVTLMQQAPSSVTLPINRVIQQTVEKIQQVEGKTTVQTVVVKEEDLVVDAISKNKPSIFTISNEGVDAGHGFAVNDKGIIVADAVLVSESGSYNVTNGGKTFKAKRLYADPSGFSFLRLGDPVGDSSSTASNTVPTFGDISKMKVGQKIIVLGNVLSSFIYDGDPDMKISINRGNAGGEVFNLDGEVLGIALFNEVTPFASMSLINASLAANADKLD
jgi:S1-C subfamily serine protease